jgi:hypothetical protein
LLSIVDGKGPPGGPGLSQRVDKSLVPHHFIDASVA